MIVWQTVPCSESAAIVDTRSWVARRALLKTKIKGRPLSSTTGSVRRLSERTSSGLGFDALIEDIGEGAEIARHAAKAGAAVTTLKLSSQFRCNGSDGYLAWLDDVLGIRPTANKSQGSPRTGRCNSRARLWHAMEFDEGRRAMDSRTEIGERDRMHSHLPGPGS